MWITGKTPTPWKSSDTKLLHKRDEVCMLSNKQPIGLHLTIYKFWTRFVTVILQEFAEDHSILNNCQEGFRPKHNTARAIQRLLHTIEDASRSHQDLCIMFVDFTNAFNTIDHQKTFRVMHDQGFPPDAVDVVTGIYSNVTTTVILNEQTGLKTKPIPIGRGTIQGDTLSPLIFILYIEPLVRWLRASGLGYTPSTANHAHPGPLTQSVGGYGTDDLYLLANTAPALSTQFSKLKAYSAWGGLQPQPKKSAVSGILNHSRATSHVQSVPDMTKILRSKLEDVFKVGETSVPFLPPNKPYKYLGVLTTLTLDFTHLTLRPPCQQSN